MASLRPNEKLSLHARRTLREAEGIARATNHNIINPKHLLFAILTEEGGLGKLFLDHAGIKKDTVAKLCFQKLQKSNDTTQKQPRHTRRMSFSKEVKDIITCAHFAASRFHSPYVGTEHLVYAILKTTDKEITNLLRMLKINREHILLTIEAHLSFENFPNFGKMLDLPDLSITRKKSDSSSATPSLSQYAFDLGADAIARGEELVGREAELARLINILGRRNKNNPLLLGEPGVGKTALVAALARGLLERKFANSLAGKRILSLDIALIVAGTNFRGEFEARLKEIIREASEHREIILFIDEIHTLIGAGNTQGGLDAANILKPALSRGEIQVIGATTFSEFKRHIEKDPALERRFQPIIIREPSPTETKTLLRRLKRQYESFHEVSIPDEILDLAVESSVRHITDRFLPDKALDLLDESSSLAKTREAKSPEEFRAVTLETRRRHILEEKERFIREGLYDDAALLLEEEKRINREIANLKKSTSSKGKKTLISVTKRDFFETLSHMTGIPLPKLENEGSHKHLAQVGKALRRRLIGQDEAIRAIETTLLRASFGLHSPDRPIGSFLLLGPTGVGKTLLGKLLAEEYFGGRDKLVRLDMSEFMERHNVAQMIGAPAGYVGYGEGGKLTEKIRRNPSAVVLFDEIEKAHPDVFNILLQILDEGTLTDAEGRTVSFRQSLIILTSNIGTERFVNYAKIGFGEGTDTPSLLSRYENIKSEVLDTLKKTVRPELLARLDHSIVFSALGEKEIAKIIRLELAAFKTRLAKRGISVILPKSVIYFLTKKSFAPEHGARLAQKNIRELIERLLAEQMLRDSGTKTFGLTVENETIICQPRKTSAIKSKKSTRNKRIHAKQPIPASRHTHTKRTR